MSELLLNNIKEPPYMVVEALRAIKTNITFSGTDVKTILITSSIPGEGKSTVAFDIAKSFADAGKSVLLLDTDMRKTVLKTRLRAQKSDGHIMGLSHYLSGQAQLDEILYKTNIAHFSIIFAGPSVPDPTALLDGQLFQQLLRTAREQFDYVIVDSPPVGSVIDSAIVSKYCDGVMLVIGHKTVHVKFIRDCIKQLEASGTRFLGAVLNKMPVKKGYGKYYGNYYGKYYGQYYGNEAKASRVAR